MKKLATFWKVKIEVKAEKKESAFLSTLTSTLTSACYLPLLICTKQIGSPTNAVG
jgi:hypothetical protein